LNEGNEEPEENKSNDNDHEYLSFHSNHSNHSQFFNNDDGHGQSGTSGFLPMRNRLAVGGSG
jgi:hypothetical protein